MRSRRLDWKFLSLLGVMALAMAQFAVADTVTLNFSAKLQVDGTSVDPSDPVIDPAKINFGDPVAISLIYDDSATGSPIAGGSTYALTGSAGVSFDGYNFDFASDPLTSIAISIQNPGQPSNVSFIVETFTDPTCTTIGACSADQMLDLNFVGALTDTSLTSLASEAGGLTCDPSASPACFEFQRDGGATDLQGNGLASAAVLASTPEPGTLALLGSGIAGLWLRRGHHPR